MNKLSVREPDLLTLLTTTPSVIANVNLPFYKRVVIALQQTKSGSSN